MANIKISDLTAASAAADANEFEINEAGTSKKVTGSQIKAYVNSADGALASKDTVATTDIDNLAVTTGKLAADAVDGTKIADDVVDSEHYVAGSIDTEHIADTAVTESKLSAGAGGTDQVLTSDGAGNITWTTVESGGGLIGYNVYTSSGTYTKGVNNPSFVVVEVVGGGGNGGSTSGNAYVGNNVAGDGGGGGGYARKKIPFASLGTTVSVTVGGAGGTSSFGAFCSATGGSNGATGNQSQLLSAGGTGSGGDINLKGSDGMFQSSDRVGGYGGMSGFGTGSMRKGAYPGVEQSIAGSAGNPYGGGGSGAARYNTNSNKSGGTGASGVVIVWEYA